MSLRLPELIQGKSPFANSAAQDRAGLFGMRVLLASLGMLFAASIVGYLIIRWQLREEWPTDLPALPITLWVSTGVLVISSVTAQIALEAARRGQRAMITVGLMMTLSLGVVFLVLQAMAWMAWKDAAFERWDDTDTARLALAGFYVLTSLHAAHVIGGLIPLAFVASRAVRGRYDAERHAGVRFTTLYWHFLDVVWILLFIIIMVW